MYPVFQVVHLFGLVESTAAPGMWQRRRSERDSTTPTRPAPPLPRENIGFPGRARGGQELGHLGRGDDGEQRETTGDGIKRGPTGRKGRKGRKGPAHPQGPDLDCNPTHKLAASLLVALPLRTLRIPPAALRETGSANGEDLGQGAGCRSSGGGSHAKRCRDGDGCR